MSAHPQAWIEIARLGGLPVWKLSKPGNTFLDHHALSGPQKREIMRWAGESGFVREVEAFEIFRRDDELDAEIRMLVETEDDAFAEAGLERGPDGVVRDEWSGDELEASQIGARVRQGRFPASTEAMVLRLATGQAGRPDPSVGEWAAILYAEDVLRLDGVWFSDKLDPSALSAPRGVIPAARLGEWRVEPDPSFAPCSPPR